MENAQPEPSMEEILASIRRIISEDEEEPAAEAAPAQPSAPSLVKKPTQSTPSPVQAAPAPQRYLDQDDAHPHLETEDVEMIKKNVASAIEDEAILDTSSAEAASSAFHALSQTVRVSDGPGHTLEDIVVGMLNPMIKEWLDANLPSIVEEKVEEEVQRVARRRR